VTTRFPSGESAAAFNPLSGRYGISILAFIKGCLLCTSQMRSVLSHDAERICFPSGKNATLITTLRGAFLIPRSFFPDVIMVWDFRTGI
jgi:hypothetical protein